VTTPDSSFVTTDHLPLPEVVDAATDRDRYAACVAVVARAMMGASDGAGALREAMEGICTVAGWPEGEAWLPTATGDGLRLTALRVEPAAALEVFAVERRAPPVPDDPVVRAWRDRRPVWRHEVPGALADAAELRSVLALPVVVGDAPLAVLAWHLHHATPDDERLAARLPDLGRLLGELLLRLRTQEDLRLSESRLVEAQQAARLGHWHYDVDTGALELSDELLRILGFEDHEPRPGIADAIGRLSASDAAQTELLMARCIEYGESYALDQQVQLPDGRRRWLHATGRPVRDGAGRIIGVAGTSQDITPRRRAEERLAQRERELRSLLENAQDVVARFGRDGRTQYINPVVARFTGLSPEEFVGRTVAECGLPADFCALWSELLARSFATGEPQEAQFVFDTPDGPRDFLSRTVAERSPDGGVQTVLVVSRDITALYQLQRRLAVSEERLQLALQGAREGYWDRDLVRDELVVSPRSAEMLGVAPGAMGRAFVEWLALVHPEDEPRRAAAVQAHLAGRTPQYDVEYRVRRADGRWLWLLERGAVTHRDGDGRPQRLVGTHTELTAQRAEREEREMLLAQVAQAERAEALGRMAGEVALDFNTLLTVIRATCDLLMGRPELSADVRGSIADMQGAAVRASVLTARLVALGGGFSPPAIAFVRPRPGPAPGLVLLVEDEAAVRQITERLLVGLGYDVCSAADAEAALRLAAVHGPAMQAVVTDVVMPGLDGRELAARLRQQFPALPVLFMSGYVPDADSPLGDDTPQTGFLQKPFTQDELRERLAALLVRV
jgi:PAS domain S-box-containing protein